MVNCIVFEVKAKKNIRKSVTEKLSREAVAKLAGGAEVSVKRGIKVRVQL